jgi:hypothetical protein
MMLVVLWVLAVPHDKQLLPGNALIICAVFDIPHRPCMSGDSLALRQNVPQVVKVSLHLPSTLKHLPSIITDYMLVTNSFRIKGRELSAILDSNTLSVYRHEDNTPVMQTCYSQGNWYEEIPTRLTTNEIEQIESLRVFTQQALMNKSRSALLEQTLRVACFSAGVRSR